MKLLLTLLALLLVPISITAEDYDPEYWECVGDSTTIEGGWILWHGPIYRRIASRWIMTVKCDTVDKIVCLKQTAWMGEASCPQLTELRWVRGYNGNTVWIYSCVDTTTYCDTVWTKKLPLYVEPGLIPVVLDSAQYKRLLELLMPPTSLDSVAKWIWGDWHGVEEILPHDSGADSLRAVKTHRDSTYDHRVMNRNR